MQVLKNRYQSALSYGELIFNVSRKFWCDDKDLRKFLTLLDDTEMMLYIAYMYTDKDTIVFAEVYGLETS